MEALEPVYNGVGISTYVRLSATLFVLPNVNFHSNMKSVCTSETLPLKIKLVFFSRQFTEENQGVWFSII